MQTLRKYKKKESFLNRIFQATFSTEMKRKSCQNLIQFQAAAVEKWRQYTVQRREILKTSVKKS